MEREGEASARQEYFSKKRVRLFRGIFLFLTLLWVCGPALVFSKTSGDDSVVSARSLLFSQWKSNNFAANYAINAEYGTHITGFGMNIYGLYCVDSIPGMSPSHKLSLVTAGAVKHSERNLGIPGASFNGKLYFQTTYNLGQQRGLFSYGDNLADRTAHNFSFFYAIYLTDDRTGQHTGGVAYAYVFSGGLVKIKYEQDYYSLQHTDQYRTAAMDVTYLRKRKDRNYGASAGFKLWTGETEGLPTSIDKQFPINGQYGSEYSHGILYIAFILETAQCTVGYDAEGIRDLIQNSYHRFRGIGEIFPLERDARVFFQISLNSFSTLY